VQTAEESSTAFNLLAASELAQRKGQRMASSSEALLELIDSAIAVFSAGFVVAVLKGIIDLAG
jgi:hypothetical protein